MCKCHQVIYWVVLLMCLGGQVGQADPLRSAPVGAGDKILIFAPSHHTLARRVTVDINGRALLPFGGKLKITGMSRAKAEAKIRKQLEPFYRGLKAVKIRILKRQKYVWVRGWVKKPGRFLVPYKASIEALLRLAEGAKSGARLDRLWFHQPGQAPKLFNLHNYYQKAQQHKAPHIGRNTVVFVPLRKEQSPELGAQNKMLRPGTSRLAVFGAVKDPGVFPCFYKVNLMQGLAMAGGPVRMATFQEILITPPKGKTYWYDLGRHLRGQGKQPLPKIKPGSVIFVPFTPLGRSKRGPVRVIGEVGKPGVWRASVEKDLTGWLTRSGGPKGSADLSQVSVSYTGSNFTIHQTVDVDRAFKEGNHELLPPTPKGRLVIYVPKKETKPRAAQDFQTILQIAISVTSVATGVILIVTTFAN